MSRLALKYGGLTFGLIVFFLVHTRHDCSGANVGSYINEQQQALTYSGSGARSASDWTEIRTSALDYTHAPWSTNNLPLTADQVVESYFQVISQSPRSPESVKSARYWLTQSFKNRWPTDLQSVYLENSDFEADGNQDGLADGWLFSANSNDIIATRTRGNLVSNPGFESVGVDLRPDGWSRFGKGLLASQPPVRVQHGWRSLIIQGDQGSGIYQKLEGLEPGCNYTLYFSTTSADAPNISVDTSGGVSPYGSFSAILVNRSHPQGKGIWYQHTIRFKATGHSATIFVYASPDFVLLDSMRLGLAGTITDWPLLEDPMPRTSQFMDGEYAQAIDFSQVISSKSDNNCAKAVLYRTISSCTPGQGYLVRVPLFVVSDPNRSTLQVRVGIDSGGGTDPESSNVVWTDFCDNIQFQRDPSWPLLNANNKNNWRPFFVSTSATEQAITIFVEVVATCSSWENVETLYVLVDNVQVYSSADEVVRAGAARGSNGKDLPEIYAYFTTRRLLDYAISQEATATANNLWRLLWQVENSKDLGEDAFDTVPVTYSGDTDSLLESRYALLYARRKYEEGHRSAERLLQAVAKSELSDMHSRNEALLCLGHLRLSQRRHEEAFSILSQIVEDNASSNEISATAELLLSKLVAEMTIKSLKAGQPVPALISSRIYKLNRVVGVEQLPFKNEFPFILHHLNALRGTRDNSILGQSDLYSTDTFRTFWLQSIIDNASKGVDQ